MKYEIWISSSEYTLTNEWKTSQDNDKIDA